jgi:hypothetical protein
VQNEEQGEIDKDANLHFWVEIEANSEEEGGGGGGWAGA